jgi:hypothetical protein
MDRLYEALHEKSFTACDAASPPDVRRGSAPPFDVGIKWWAAPLVRALLREGQMTFVQPLYDLLNTPLAPQ